MGASAKANSADRARGGGINTHETAARFVLDSHFRNPGNAHSVSHQTQKAAELAAFENNLLLQAGAIAGGDSVIAETMPSWSSRKSSALAPT